MSEPFRIAVSGLNDAALRIVNATSNIVNASSTTADGKKIRGTDVISSSNDVGENNLGVESQITQRSSAEGVDLASEFVSIDQAVISYRANAAVIKAQQENDKTLLDELA